MSFESKIVGARLEALETEMGEIRQNQTVLSMALIRLTKLVEDASEMLDHAAEAAAPGGPEGSD